MHAFSAARSRWAAFREARRAFVRKRPALKFSLFVASWLPLGLFATEYVFNVKAVRGRSMQVRTACPLSLRVRGR